jgi:hypothetical protein
MKDSVDSERRSVFVSLLVAFIYELFNRAAISNVEVGPFEIRDLSLVQKALPVVFAYLVYDLMVLGIRNVQSYEVHSEIIRLFDKPLTESGLDLLLVPQETSLFGPALVPTSDNRNRLVEFLTALLFVGYMTLPFLIEVYMLYRLFDAYGSNDPLVWVSSIFAVGFLVFAIALYVSAFMVRALPAEDGSRRRPPAGRP